MSFPLAFVQRSSFYPFTSFPKLAANSFALLVAFTSVYLRGQSMVPHLSAIAQSNAALVGGLKGAPVAVFLGGTSGIGQGLAETFARWRNGNAHIIILGRNEAAARDIIAHFPKPTASGASWSHEFIQCDATLMKNVRAAAEKILSKHPKVNYLVMTPGYFSTSGRDETSEGIDKKLAVHYYSRWRLTYDLLPALKKAKEEGEHVRVLSVYSTGYGGPINEDDFGLKKTFSMKNALESAATYNDLMVEAFHERNPGIVFSHAFPGGVSTNLMSSARTPWMRAVAPVVNTLTKPFLVTQDQCAEYLWSGLLNTNIGAYRMGRRGENLGKQGYHGNEKLRQKLWEHSKDATDV